MIKRFAYLLDRRKQKMKDYVKLTRELRTLEILLLILAFCCGFLLGYLAHYLFGDFL